MIIWVSSKIQVQFGDVKEPSLEFQSTLYAEDDGIGILHLCFTNVLNAIACVPCHASCHGLLTRKATKCWEDIQMQTMPYIHWWYQAGQQAPSFGCQGPSQSERSSGKHPHTNNILFTLWRSLKPTSPLTVIPLVTLDFIRNSISLRRASSFCNEDDCYHYIITRKRGYLPLILWWGRTRENCPWTGRCDKVLHWASLSQETESSFHQNPLME